MSKSRFPMIFARAAAVAGLLCAAAAAGEPGRTPVDIPSLRPPDRPRSGKAPVVPESTPQGRVIDEKTADRLVNNIPDYAVLCPVCNQTVRQVRLMRRESDDPDAEMVPDLHWRLRADDFDADLCPYPDGVIRFQADFTQCAHCGFAARQTEFALPQPPDVRDWVRADITPFFQRALLRLVAEPTPPPGQPVPVAALRRIAEVFDRQASLPDIVRMESARRYYQRVDAVTEVRAEVAQLTAWAYRRAQNAAPEGAHLLTSLKPVINALDAQRAEGERVAVKDRIDDLLALLDMRTRDGSYRFNWHQRHSAQFLLAGFYDRQGDLPYAMYCLQAAAAAARDVDARDPQRDPMWTELAAEFDSADLTLDERAYQLLERRTAMAEYAEARMAQLRMEAAHLASAADLWRQTLDTDDGLERHWPDVPARAFLIGEWFRRSGHLPQAWLWLSTAERLDRHLRSIQLDAADRAGGLEALATAQLQHLREYWEKLPEDPPRPDLGAWTPEEEAQARRLVERYLDVRARHVQPPAPPATPATPDDEGV